MNLRKGNSFIYKINLYYTLFNTGAMPSVTKVNPYTAVSESVLQITNAGTLNGETPSHASLIAVV